MSEKATSTKALAAPPKPSEKVKFRVGFENCVILHGDQTIGGRALGFNSEVNTRLVVHSSRDMDPWMGFSMDFPIGVDNEDRGFGACHRYDHQNSKIVLTDQYRLTVSAPSTYPSSQS